MQNMGGGWRVDPSGGYWGGGGYGPGASSDPGIGGSNSGGSLGPGIQNFFSNTGSDYIGAREGSGSPWDPFNGTGFTPASQRFQHGHQYSSIDPEFYYGRAQWQARQKDPQYQQWLSYTRLQKLFAGLGIRLPDRRPPPIDTPYDDMLRQLRTSISIGGMPTHSGAFGGFQGVGAEAP